MHLWPHPSFKAACKQRPYNAKACARPSPSRAFSPSCATAGAVAASRPGDGRSHPWQWHRLRRSGLTLGRLVLSAPSGADLVYRSREAGKEKYGGLPQGHPMERLSERAAQVETEIGDDHGRRAAYPAAGKDQHPMPLGRHRVDPPRSIGEQISGSGFKLCQGNFMIGQPGCCQVPLLRDAQECGDLRAGAYSLVVFTCCDLFEYVVHACMREGTDRISLLSPSLKGTIRRSTGWSP